LKSESEALYVMYVVC